MLRVGAFVPYVLMLPNRDHPIQKEWVSVT